MTDWSKASAVYLTGNEKLFNGLIDQLSLDVLDFEHRRFPDGESYVRVDSDVTDRTVLLFCSLDRPDPKFLPMVYTARALREEGADSIVLVAPYLAYMRQDKQFRPGEGVTSRYFAEMVDQTFDGLLTVDPHLHRYSSMNELYDIPCTVTHADPALADWIDKNVNKPYLIGPDSESEQWVSQVAERIDQPYNVLTKVRLGDRDVEITFEDPQDRRDRTPVLVDDIISTAGTMMKATRTLRENDYPAPICVGVHAIFAEDAYAELKEAGAASIVSCNTINHTSNEIDLAETIHDQIGQV